jgi:starch synthase
MLHVLEHSVGYWYDDRDMWQRLMRRAMKTDFSWAVSARKYMELYRNLLGLPAEEPKPVKKRAPRTTANASEKKPAAKKPAAKKPAAKKSAAKKSE